MYQRAETVEQSGIRYTREQPKQGLANVASRVETEPTPGDENVRQAPTTGTAWMVNQGKK
jgi:hypothetical protein